MYVDVGDWYVLVCWVWGGWCDWGWIVVCVYDCVVVFVDCVVCWWWVGLVFGVIVVVGWCIVG